MRILISDDLSSEAKSILERIPGAQVDVKVGLKPSELREIIGGYEALAVRSATKVTKEILEAAGKLRVIGRAGTGVDNSDLAAATRRGVVVLTAPGGNSVPLTEQTKNMVGAAQLAQMKPGALVVNCARGGLVDEKALADALRKGKLGGAALDVFEEEPPPADHPLFGCPNFIATPHLGGSTEDAQQNVATIVCEAMVEYLTTGTIRNAVNVPSVSGEVLERLGPFLRLCEKMGALSAQLALQGEPAGAPEQIEIAYAGEVTQQPTAPLTAAVLKGVLSTFMAEPVNEVSAPALAKERGLAVKEVSTSETPDFASLLSVRLRCGQSAATEVAGTIVGKREPRLVRVDNFELEAVPEGHIIVFYNKDAPGVIGNVGHALGEAKVNIAQFALARDRTRGEALALVNVDTAAPPELLEKLRRLPNVRRVQQVVL